MLAQKVDLGNERRHPHFVAWTAECCGMQNGSYCARITSTHCLLTPDLNDIRSMSKGKTEPSAKLRNCHEEDVIA